MWNSFLNKNTKSKNPEKGSAMVIALLILTLLTAFVALAVLRTTNETIATSNDTSESKTFAAAQGSLEIMTRNFDKIFEEKLSPTTADLDKVEDNIPPDFSDDFDFAQTITKTKDAQVVDMSGQLYQGLKALRDEWRIESTVTEKNSGVQVALRRQFFNNRIPIFQFGIFYDDDLEFHPGPRFDFGGRVHSNGNLFLMAGTGLFFSSKVSSVGQVMTDVARNGTANRLGSMQWGDNVRIKNASGSYVQLKWNMGSVLNSTVNGIPLFDDPNRPGIRNPDMPTVYKNATWESNKELFQGNLLSEQKSLDLPLTTKINGEQEYIELIKRGKNVGDLGKDGIPITADNDDSLITTKERYANKKGIRISLADSRAKLPGCANAPANCGIRLDGSSSGNGDNSDANGSRGYLPKPMRNGAGGTIQATRLNGSRMRPAWIKIELVNFNPATQKVTTEDATEDILSLGVTQSDSFIPNNAKDSRSIIKLQRYTMQTFNQSGSVPDEVRLSSADTRFWSFVRIAGKDRNVVAKEKRNGSCSTPPCSFSVEDDGFAANETAHYVTVSEGTTEYQLVPFPINMFDSREGYYNFNDLTVYGQNVPWNGVMGLIDIDVANMKKFLNGEFNNNFPSSGTLGSDKFGGPLKHQDVPDEKGWVLYVSDRRGDKDFDGEYDMEDVFGNNDGDKQPGEDVNDDGILNAIYTTQTFLGEAPKYKNDGLFNDTGMTAPPTYMKSYVAPSFAATIDHSYFRRAVRLINAKELPGIYDFSNPDNTKGFTVASENGIYVLGNYNASGISSVGAPTESVKYLPQGDDTTTDAFERRKHVPSSIVADAVTILSNNWQDSRSFAFPSNGASNNRKASETTVRFAILSGDAKSSYASTPHQGNSDIRLSGGVHNFKRFLEDWDNVRLNYCGSIINLYNSRNSNGTYKNHSSVRNPPIRNWVFDTSFLNPDRLPPGTPYFQNIQLTGFQRVN